MTTLHALPQECLLHFFGMMDMKELAKSERVCKEWRVLVTDLWGKFYSNLLDCHVKNQTGVLELKKKIFLRQVLLDNIKGFYVHRVERQINSTKQELIYLSFKNQRVFFFGSDRSGLLFSYRKCPSNSQDWETKCQKRLAYAAFPEIDEKGKVSRRRVFKPRVLMTGNEAKLRKIGNRILYCDQHYYGLFDFDLKCRFANKQQRPFLMCAGNIVYYEENSRLIAYDTTLRKETGSIQISKEDCVASELVTLLNSSLLLIPTQKGCLLLCDFVENRILFRKDFGSEFLDLQVKGQFLILLTKTGALTFCRVLDGTTIKCLDLNPNEKNLADWQRKINFGDDHVLYFDLKEKILGIYNIEDGKCVATRKYKRPIVHLLANKRRFCIFGVTSSGEYFCQINVMSTGREIAKFNLPNQNIPECYVKISKQLLFICSPLIADEKFSHSLCFIDLVTGVLLNQRWLEKSLYVSKVDFDSGQLTFMSGEQATHKFYYIEDFLAKNLSH